ncbi:GNAT family N-acetyltransferase [Blastococcus sp. TF02A-35]|uniref:GNAT family N-acetyltransferase n=1 Tax=Blastococcus sp. TF02A-35 TaxID=2559612 RepID=UPI0010747728|nr:GNAT family N-acetyltransferase [Blastococcus sp. TF02A_35]TFV45143.1 GNAT family N-acetyltransferase [Blastococcus sp. TF02A_35]
MPSDADATRVHRAGVPDAAELFSLVQALAAENGDAVPDAGTLEGWQRVLGRPEAVVLLARRDGAAVGYVSAVRKLHLWLGRDVLALDDLFVRAGHRDAGLGRLLMAELARLATAEDLVVRWEMREDNVAAQRFYERLGARLRRKVVASWGPEAQRRFLGS